MSQAASETDVRLYLQLSNPEVTAPVRVQEEDEYSEAAPEDEVELEESEEYENEGEENTEHEEGNEFEEPDSVDEEDFEEERRSAGGGTTESAPPLQSPSPPLTFDPLETAIPMNPQELMIEKQSALLELDRLRAQGCTPSKTFTLDDDLTLIQWEIRRHLMMIDEQNSISFMKDALRLGFSGLEALNSKAGPLLELDGWAASASHELSTGHKYDNSLSKLYKKYWRRGNGNSPELELAFGILGSMGAFHFRKKFMSSRPIPRRPTLPVDDSDDEEAPLGR